MSETKYPPVMKLRDDAISDALAQIEHLHVFLRDFEAEVAAKVRSLEKDAARYRWLRDHGDTKDWEQIGWESDKDAAVDAAMENA